LAILQHRGLAQKTSHCTWAPTEGVSVGTVLGQAG
jgi:hypothetical protein